MTDLHKMHEKLNKLIENSDEGRRWKDYYISMAKGIVECEYYTDKDKTSQIIQMICRYDPGRKINFYKDIYSIQYYKYQMPSGELFSVSAGHI